MSHPQSHADLSAPSLHNLPMQEATGHHHHLPRWRYGGRCADWMTTAPRHTCVPRLTPPITGWFLVGNEGMRALYVPFKGLHRALTPSFPTKNQGDYFPKPEYSRMPRTLFRCHHGQNIQFPMLKTAESPSPPSTLNPKP